MKKAVTATIIVTVTIVVVLGLFYYSYSQIRISLNDVTFDSIDWTSFSFSTLVSLGLNALTGNWLGVAFDLIDGINLNLIFGLSNYGIFPVYIPDLSYDLSINGVNVGQGYTRLDATIYPGQTQEIPVLQNFQKNSLVPAVSSIVSTGGIINLHVSGTAYFKLFGLSIPIPFGVTKQVSIVDEIQKRVSNELKSNPQQSDSSSSSLTESLSNAFESLKKEKIGTVISLNVPYSTATEGTKMSISGRLVRFDGIGLSNAVVYLKDEDTGSGDDVLATLRTDSNGNFRYDWITTTMDPFDSIVELYSVFEGTQDYDSSRSNQFNINVREPVQFQQQPQIPSSSQPSFKQTSISLNIPYTSINEGDGLPISGRLIDSDGKGVQGATVYIKDEDTGSGDDVIIILTTDSAGNFGVKWAATGMDPFDNVVEIYAVFEGATYFSNARSIQINVSVT